jgi:uncharacterized protein YvpB
LRGVRPVNLRRFVLRLLLPLTALAVVGATLLAGGRASPRPPHRPAPPRTVTGRSTVPAQRAATRVLIGAPTVQQALPNDCEAASLQILLATLGVQRDQLTLQGELPRSGPLDPIGSGPTAVWGDPREGFVGRVDGSGTAGGFGVYQGPIAQVARRNGRTLRDLTGSTVDTLLGELRAGHAVMAWVALSQGPYGHWRSPSGRPIAVNFGEHAVVLVGIGPNGLTVKNPLQGTTELWSLARFSSSWPSLGRRALAGV